MRPGQVAAGSRKRRFDLRAADVEHTEGAADDPFADVYSIGSKRPRGPTSVLAHMQRVHKELSHFELLEQSLYTPAALSYFDPNGGTRTFDCFTNEIGLFDAAERSGMRGGAVVGVGGSVLDIGAATRAELIISVDANPAIRDWMYFIVALFAHVDASAKKFRWDDARASEAVSRFLDPPAKDADKVATELQRVLKDRVPKELRDRLPELIRAVHHRAGEQLSEWLPVPTHWFRRPDAPAAVAHLRKLAREGKIYCITSTLNAPGLIEGIGKLCAWHHASVNAVNLSNAFEYMSSSRPVFDRLGSLPLSSDAKLFMVSGHVKNALEQGAFRGARAELVRSLGHVLEGAVVSASEWLGPEGRGQQVDELVWRTPSCVQMIVWNAIGSKIEAVGEAWLNAAGVGMPTSPRELAALEAMIDQELGRRSSRS